MKPYIKLVTLFALVLLGFLLYAVFPPDYGVDSNNHDAYHQDHTNHPDTPPPVPPPNNVPASPPNPFVPPPPPPPRYPPDVVKEATLGPCPLFQNQPLQQPKPIVPASQPVSVDNLAPIAPTADQTTIRLNTAKSLDYARPNELWQFSVINSKPDVFIASEGHTIDINNHYGREHRIYSLMKWVLRVHRRDSMRKSPLMMVDVGSNHGLFSMVAGASGAHVVAFEPQTPLRSVINLAARLNQISDRIRVLPFAALDKFRKIAMSNYQEGDGGVGFLDYSTQESVIKTQTIRVDSIPSFNRLFDTNSNKLLSLRTPNDFGQDYAAALEKNNKEPNGTMLDKTLAFKQPIHFLKIDVEGFELPALESASGLYEAGLVEHTVLEFGPPSRWDVTIEDGETMSLAEKRAVTLAQAKKILLRAVQEWNLDIYLLPAIGWEATVNWMVQHGVDYRNGGVGDNRAVYRLKAWDFDGKGLEGDEFEAELEAKDQVVTEFIPLPEHLIEPYLESLESIGEMYLWFVKKDNKLPIMTTTEL